MLRLKLSLLYILLFTTGLSAQAVFEHAETCKWAFSFTPNQRNTNNKVLNQLALAHLKIPEKASFTFEFRYTIDVNFQLNDSLLVTLTINPIQVTGDKSIKGFDIQQLLKPSEYDMNVMLKHPGSGTIWNQRKIVTIVNGTVPIFTFPDSLWKEGMQVQVNFNRISFSEADYRKIEKELMAIRDYYASASLGDTIYKQLRKSRINTGDLQEVMKLYTTGIKGLFLLNQSLAVKSEIVPGNDPLKVAEKTRILSYNFYEYLDYIRKSNLKLLTGNIYLKLAEAYLQSLVDADRLSRQVDYYSSPFYYKLYSNSITATQLNEAKDMFVKEAELRGMNHFDVTALSQYILREYLQKSKSLTAEDRYVEAVDLLAGALKFKNLNPYDQYSNAVESELESARNGLISSYTGIIQRSLDKNLFSLAEKYLDEAETYTQKSGMNDSGTNRFKELYIKMADIHVQLGNNYIARNDYKNSLDEFNRSLELLSSYESRVRIQAEDGLLISVRSLYNQMIERTVKSVGIKDYSLAALQLDKAEKFASEYPSFYPDKTYTGNIKYEIAALKYTDLINHVQASTYAKVTEETIQDMVEAYSLNKQYQFRDAGLLDTLVVNLGVPYVSSIFSQGRLKHWAGESDSAIFYANAAINLAAKLDLNNNSIITDQYNQLLSLARESFCSEAMGEYTSLLNQASNLFKDNKFEEALHITTRARELVYSKASCGLTTIDLNNLLLLYQHQITWDKMVSEAFKLLQENKFQESADLILKAESIYSYYHLDTSGLANVGYYDLAKTTDNLPMLRHAISYHISRAKLDQALSLMERLRLTGVPAEETDDLQESLARNLSQRDKAEIPDPDVKAILMNYTLGNKWYQKFEKVYKYYLKS